jgi:hypothetical protein
LTAEVGAYRGFTVSVSASGNSRLAHASSLFNYNSEIRLQAVAGGPVYIAHIGESNVGLTQSIDYQLRHLEDRLAQAQAGLAQLQARQTGFQAEMEKPWGHLAEYRRLRRDYEATGASLAAAGVEIGSTAQLAVPGEGPDSDAAETADTPAETVAEALGAPRNPLTGLETYPLEVAEHAGDTATQEEVGNLAAAETAAQTFVFGQGEKLLDSADESDIFATGPVFDDETAAPAMVGVTQVDLALTLTPAIYRSLPRPEKASGRKHKKMQPAVSDQAVTQGSFAW